MSFDLILFKNNFIDFFTNRVLLCAIFSWFAAQLIKLITTPCYKKDFSVLHTLFGSGGMPSSHSAAVCAKFGGGGHKGAAGASLNMALEEAEREVIAALPGIE